MGKNNSSRSTTEIKALLLSGILAFCFSAGAQSKKGVTKPTSPPPAAEVAPTSTPAKGELVDISDIENKYWAPKDTDFNVVQNRTYTKEKRLAVSLQYGPVINETLNEGNASSLGVNYYFSERWGVQLNYTLMDLKNSDATQAFIAAGGGPDYGRATNYYDLGINWIPFYAKMSVIGKKIIYFDMAFTPTIGMMNYEARTRNLGDFDKSSFAYGFDITQLFFMHSNFAVRVDLKQRWYKEQIYKYYGTGAGTKLKDKNSDSTLLMFGLAVFF